ncbi:MAG: hypothetical protein EBS01_16625 [Verrucomicrobia bacterium]|nr:hypothetical protein [Verrucomicrobiota bacterium]
MKRNSDPIQRLFGLARSARPEPPPAELSYGFTTRVLARVNEALPESPWERLALGALPIGAIAALLCFLVPSLMPHEARVSEDLHVAQAFIQTAIEQ